MSKKEEMMERAEKLNRKLEGKNFRIKVRESVSYTHLTLPTN